MKYEIAEGQPFIVLERRDTEILKAFVDGADSNGDLYSIPPIVPKFIELILTGINHTIDRGVKVDELYRKW